jgi:hypothetical protein
MVASRAGAREALSDQNQAVEIPAFCLVNAGRSRRHQAYRQECPAYATRSTNMALERIVNYMFLVCSCQDHYDSGGEPDAFVERPRSCLQLTFRSGNRPQGFQVVVPFCDNWVLAHKGRIAGQHAAEILRPWSIDGTVENKMAKLAGAQLLRLGQNCEVSIDLPDTNKSSAFRPGR